MMNRFALALSILLIAACTNPPAQPGAATTSDTLLIHGGIAWIGPDQRPSPGSAIVVRKGRIDFVGPLAEAERRAPGARRLDAAGMTVLPGLVDSHAHVDGLGTVLDTVDLTGTKSVDEVIARIAEYAKTVPAGSWITGRGWDQNDWPVREYPTAALLDAAVPDHPVCVSRVDGHASLANSAAMKLAGIDATTKDPEGGRILRDASGAPSGVFIDNAEGLVERVISEPSREVRKARLRKALENLASHGLTGAHEAGSRGPDELIALYRELIDEGAMPTRVYYMLPADDALLDTWIASGPLVDFGYKLTVRSVKIYADGALGSRGAAMLEPYSDEPSRKGLLVTQPEQVETIAKRAADAGFQVATHAIGDRGVRIALDAYAKAGAKAEDRFRIEHFQVAALDDIDRLAKMGVIAAMQPTHATSDMPWAEERVGPERIKGAYAWRKVLDAGGRLALGSDFPVEHVNPFYGIHSAVTRQDHDGHPPGGWTPSEKLSLAEAVRGFTLDPAFAAFEDETRGTIEAGKWADFTIVDGDFANAPASEIWKTKVRYTIVNGEIAYKGK
ncbi:MAG: amidohydrolase [Thermoanaerobaculia bacterium]|nr:amidohydrolase [Thermoanaerobaculia bacterium]